MFPLDPDIKFAEACYRQEHLRAIAHQEPLFGRLRARWSKRRRPEPTASPLEVVGPAGGAPGAVVGPTTVVSPDAGIAVAAAVPGATAATRPGVGVHIPAQRLPGQVGSPAPALATLDESPAASQVTEGATEPVRRPAPH